MRTGMGIKSEEPTGQFTRITCLDNQIEAQLVTSILTDQGIPHHLRSFHDTAYDGLYQMQKGWGELSAPLPYRDRILDIIDRIRTEPPHFCEPDETDAP